MQQREWETAAREAEAQAAAKAMVNSPEFRARIAKARADGEAARAMVNSAEFQAHMARLRDLGVQIQREVDEPVVRDPAPAGPTP